MEAAACWDSRLSSLLSALEAETRDSLYKVASLTDSDISQMFKFRAEQGEEGDWTVVSKDTKFHSAPLFTVAD
eukprot:749691-Hanusia_phi.AAC.3